MFSHGDNRGICDGDSCCHVSKESDVITLLAQCHLLGTGCEVARDTLRKMRGGGGSRT